MKKYIGTKVIEAESRSTDGGDGYKVVYADGYVSWSPKTVFEDAYRPVDAMTFGDAIHMLKLGKKVARAGWSGKGMWLDMQMPHFNGDMTLPFIYMKTVTGDLVPWLASQTDMLAEDYVLVD